MALTPIDVQQKTFGTALRGYDLDEVDDFLDEVVTSLKSYEQRLTEAQDRIAALETELAGRGDSESAISRALVAAQRSADMIIDEARSEAERVLADAKAEAEMFASVRREEQTKLDLEVASLRSGISEIRDRVRALAGSLEDDLDRMDAAVTDGENLLSATRDDAGDPEADTAVDAFSSPDSAPVEVGDTGGSGFPVETQAMADAPTEMEGEALDDSSLHVEVIDLVEVEDTEPDDGDEPDAGSSTGSWAASWEEAEGADAGRLPGIDDDSTSADPLEEALAEATFGRSGTENAADALSSDRADPDEAWDRTGLDVWTDSEDDRPRRPWE